jgi:glycogen phosphorylase
VHVQVLHGKIDRNDVLTGVTVQDLELAVREIPRNDLLTSVAEPGVVAVA